MSTLILALFYRPYFPPMVIALAVGGAAALALWSWRRGRAAAPVAGALGLAMRLLAIGAIGFLLLGPSTLPENDVDPTRTPVNFLVDASGSMQTVDLPPETEDHDQISRYEYALDTWLGPAQLAELREHHEVRIYSFGDRVRATLPEPADANLRGSNVAESVYELLTTMHAADPESAEAISGGGGALVLLSDGRDSRGANPNAAAQLAEARGIKLHTVTLGGATLSRDLALTATPRQPYLMVNEPGQIDVRLEQVNAENTTSTLRIRHGGEETTQPVAFTHDPRQTIELPVEHDEPGLYAYEIAVDPLPGEPEANNNKQTVFIEVTSQRMRVLVLEGQPFWDTKFLAQSLRKDDRVELTQITQINNERQERIVTRVDGPATPPRNFEDLARYDVIILGRGMENVLSVEAAEALPRYVGERGGRVVFARGRPYDAASSVGPDLAAALRNIEPVVWGDGHLADQPLELTDAGRGHPVFAALMRGTNGAPAERDLPTFRSASVVEQLKPATRVLARMVNTATETATDPDSADEASGGASGGVVSMPYGRGMVVGVLGEGLWRWSLAASDNEALAGVFDGFWSGMVRWLVLGADAGAGRDVSLRLSGRSIGLGDELTVTLVQRGAAAEADLRVVVTDSAGQTHEPALANRGGADVRRVGSFTPAAVGIHTLRVLRPDGSPYRVPNEDSGAAPENAAQNVENAPLETKFTAYDGNTELLRTAADPAFMRTLAVSTGGQAFDPAAPQTLGQVLAVERASRFVPPTPRFVWDAAAVMVALLAWVGAEWLIRKKGGLL